MRGSPSRDALAGTRPIDPGIFPTQYRPSVEDPAAALLVVGGIAAATAVLSARRRY